MKNRDIKNPIEEVIKLRKGYVNIKKIDSNGVEIVDLRSEHEKAKNPLKIPISALSELKKLNAMKLIY